jgi:hypothetical protein
MFDLMRRLLGDDAARMADGAQRMRGQMATPRMIRTPHA